MERHARAYVPEWLRRYHAFAVFSTDDGRSWGDPVATLNDATEAVVYYDQRMTMMSYGRLLTMAWVHDVIRDVTLTARAGFSDDGGRTWSEPSRPASWVDPSTRSASPTGGSSRPMRAGLRRAESGLPERGRRAHLGGRRRDRALGRGAPGRDGRPRQQLDVPDADLPLWGTMWGWTFGGPCPVQLPDGRVVVTFFATGVDGITAIRSVTLEV